MAISPNYIKPIINSIEAHQEVKLSYDEIQSELTSIIPFFEASQYALIKVLVHNDIWKGPIPPKPEGEGDIEFGLVPRWLNEPPAFIKDYLQKHPWLKDIWNGLASLMTNHIDDDNYHALLDAIEEGGVIAADGTYYGTGKYEQLDPGWIWSLLHYLFVRYTKDYAPFPTSAPATVHLSGSDPNKVTIAMIGDWGTGPFKNGASIEIMKQIANMKPKPDYIIHLGDVYYSGTNEFFKPPNEEQQHLLDCWPSGYQAKSFTMNSNHEMYSGAKGLFDIALKPGTPFSAQQQNTYFVLQYAGWTLLGLDSGYFSESPMFMVGSMAGARNPQADWIKQLKLSPDKVIVLSHHNGLSYDGKSEPRYPADNPNSFWDEVNEVLGDDPAAWYWGHIHNGIVYKSPTVHKRKTLARCLGHAALPFGKAWGIKEDETYVDYYTHTPNPSAGPKRVKNGLVLLTIKSDGSVIEEFFDQGDHFAKYKYTY